MLAAASVTTNLRVDLTGTDQDCNDCSVTKHIVETGSSSPELHNGKLVAIRGVSRGESSHRPSYSIRIISMKTYMCVICGFLYEEEKGLPDEGIAPGTKWDDVPMNWKCPECQAGKDDFEMVEI